MKAAKIVIQLRILIQLNCEDVLIHNSSIKTYKNSHKDWCKCWFLQIRSGVGYIGPVILMHGSNSLWGFNHWFIKITLDFRTRAIHSSLVEVLTSKILLPGHTESLLVSIQHDPNSISYYWN